MKTTLLPLDILLKYIERTESLCPLSDIFSKAVSLKPKFLEILNFFLKDLFDSCTADS